MRRSIIAGNWKMNKTVSEAKSLISSLIPMVENIDNIDIVICPPYTCIGEVAKLIAGTNISLGAQNMHFKSSGAFTGEVSAEMIKEFGVKYVILGHSERREYFAESDESINKKIGVAIGNDITPIVCVGETLAQREKGQTADVLRSQIKAALDGYTACDVNNIVIAYEPIWAIGTGETASCSQANDGCRLIRETVSQLFGQDCANAIRIQYGGSMNSKNSSELIKQSDIDGGLIGGASLIAGDFAKIIYSAVASG